MIATSAPKWWATGALGRLSAGTNDAAVPAMRRAGAGGFRPVCTAAGIRGGMRHTINVGATAPPADYRGGDHGPLARPPVSALAGKHDEGYNSGGERGQIPHPKSWLQTDTLLELPQRKVD